MDSGARGMRIRDMHDVHGRLNNHAAGHVNHHAVLRERRVERRERLPLTTRQLSKVLGHEPRRLFQRFGERRHANFCGKTCERRERCLKAAIHEHEPVPVRVADDERGDIRRTQRARAAAWRGDLEHALRDWRHAREVPVFVARGRKAECAEAVHRFAAQGRRPRVDPSAARSVANASFRTRQQAALICVPTPACFVALKPPPAPNRIRVLRARCDSSLPPPLRDLSVARGRARNRGRCSWSSR